MSWTHHLKYLGYFLPIAAHTAVFALSVFTCSISCVFVQLARHLQNRCVLCRAHLPLTSLLMLVLRPFWCWAVCCQRAFGRVLELDSMQRPSQRLCTSENNDPHHLRRMVAVTSRGESSDEANSWRFQMISRIAKRIFWSIKALQQMSAEALPVAYHFLMRLQRWQPNNLMISWVCRFRDVKLAPHLF